MTLSFTDDDKARLAEALAKMRAAEAASAAADAEREKAAAVERGLRERAAAIEASFARPVVAPDADRVARLLSGESPAALDLPEAEACEARNRALKIEQAQLSADADAVALRAGELAEAARRAAAEVDLARRGFVMAFGRIVHVRYKDAAVAFARGPWRTLFLAFRAMRAVDQELGNALELDVGAFRLHVMHGDSGSAGFRDCRAFADTDFPAPLGAAVDFVAALAPAPAAPAAPAPTGTGR